MTRSERTVLNVLRSAGKPLTRDRIYKECRLIYSLADLALFHLENDGLVRKVDRPGRHSYELTDIGRCEVPRP
jgi:predicted transcriptional regulator